MKAEFTHNSGLRCHVIPRIWCSRNFYDYY